MHSINVLIIGNSKFLPHISSSKFLNKLYLISNNDKNFSDLSFVTFKELAQKCKSLKIDLVIVEDEKYIKQGIADVLSANFVNCIAANSKWVDSIISKISAKKIANRYDILTPLTLTYPKNFPLLVKFDDGEKIVNSIQEIIDIKQNIYQKSPVIAESIFLEEIIDGIKFNLISLYDGKNILSFPPQKINIDKSIIKEYSKKLENLLNTEQFKFIGFINSKLILVNDKIYNTGFSLEIPKPDVECDLLYIFILAIYQKLNEINLLT